MDYVQFFTNAELAEAAVEAGEVLVSNSPHPSETMGSDGENGAHSSEDTAVSPPPSGIHLSQERRKRTYTDMLENSEDPENPSRFAVCGDLRQQFAAAAQDTSFVEISGSQPEANLPIPVQETSKVQGDLIKNGKADDTKTIAIKNFSAWNARKKYHNAVATGMKALIAHMTTAAPTSVNDFDPFKLPIKLAKGVVGDYKLKILKRLCLRDVVKIVESPSMQDVSRMATDVALIPLNAVAFNAFDGEISAESLKMLQLAVTMRKQVAKVYEATSDFSQTAWKEYYTSLRNKCHAKKQRNHPSI